MFWHSKYRYVNSWLVSCFLFGSRNPQLNIMYLYYRKQLKQNKYVFKLYSNMVVISPSVTNKVGNE